MNNMHSMVERIFGTDGDDVLFNTPYFLPEGVDGGEGIFGAGGNDVLNLTASGTEGASQIHAYGQGGNDVFNLSFGTISGFGIGHHVYGDFVLDGPKGNDTFNFTDFNDVTGVVVGRLDDFDPKSDTIQIDGVDLDLRDLPSNVRILDYAGDLDDPEAADQQWLLIDTGKGSLFYALDGARVDMTGNGGADAGRTEAHFISGATDFETIFAEASDTFFKDQENHVPVGLEAKGGIIINDADRTIDDVQEDILGTAESDLIAAGLNDDRVLAGAGDDRVWGGSGNDVLSGGVGNDVLRGGGENDRIFGGNGDDVLDGGLGADFMTGGEGADVFAFYHIAGRDVIRDFATGTDKIHIFSNQITDFEAVSERTTFTDFGAVIDFGGDDVLLIKDASADTLSADDFMFG